MIREIGNEKILDQDVTEGPWHFELLWKYEAGIDALLKNAFTMVLAKQLEESHGENSGKTQRTDLSLRKSVKR